MINRQRKSATLAEKKVVPQISHMLAERHEEIKSLKHTEKKQMNSNIPQIITSGLIYLDGDVSISFFELREFIPFDVKRVYTISTKEKQSLRGQHAHLNQDQVIICIDGFAYANITSQKGEVFNFNILNHALYIPKNNWIEIEMQPHSTLLCFASENYDKLISIFDKEAFLCQSK